MLESLLVQLNVNHTPDDQMLAQPLWTRGAVGKLISQRLGPLMPARTLAT